MVLISIKPERGADFGNVLPDTIMAKLRNAE